MLSTTLLVISSGLGLSISVYFTLMYYGVVPPDGRYVPRFCRLEGDACRLVLSHRDARLFGVPNAVIAIPYYALVIVAGAWGPASPLIRPLLVASWCTIVLAVYLAFSLLVKLRVFCPLCYAAHALNAVIAVLLTWVR